jgi:hypothetical protein
MQTLPVRNLINQHLKCVEKISQNHVKKFTLFCSYLLVPFLLLYITHDYFL